MASWIVIWISVSVCWLLRDTSWTIHHKMSPQQPPYRFAELLHSLNFQTMCLYISLFIFCLPRLDKEHCDCNNLIYLFSPDICVSPRLLSTFYELGKGNPFRQVHTLASGQHLCVKKILPLGDRAWSQSIWPGERNPGWVLPPLIPPAGHKQCNWSDPTHFILFYYIRGAQQSVDY